jgi:DNA invertase Pin-like site-specific DNA recombinase
MNMVGLYIRVSDAKQTYENQRLELAAYCIRAGHAEFVTFSDVESGSTNDRQGFNDLLAACSRKELTKVLFVDLDRISRMGAKYAHDFFHLLRNAGVGYKSMRDTWLDSDAGIPMLEDILISVCATFGKNEREKIVLRTKAGLERARAEGKMLGRRPIIGSRGHVGDKIRIEELHRAGFSQRKIAAELRLSKGVVQRCIESSAATA